MAQKINIVVYKDFSYKSVWKRFTNLADFEKWSNALDDELDALQVTVNGAVIYGWDEFYDMFD